MSGEGADELFGGYLSYLEDKTANWYLKVPFKLRNIASKLVENMPDVWGLNFIYRYGKKLEDEYIGINRIARDSEAQKLVKLPKQIKTKDITKKIL